MTPAKSPLLVAIYASPDVYPPTVNAVHILDHTFCVRIVARNTDETAASWPPGVKIDRIGITLSPRAHEAASKYGKVRDFLRYLWALRRAIATSRPRVIYAYDPIAFAAAMMVRARIPVVFHIHDNPTLEELSLGSFQTWLIRYALKRTRDAALVVFPEKNRAAYWLRAAGDDRMPMVVPNGSARDFYLPGRDWEALTATRFENQLALYMGWIGSSHGEINAIRAIPITAGAKLALMGTPHSEFIPVLKRVIRETQAADRIKMHPWSAAKKNELLESAGVGLIVYKPISLNWKFAASAVNKLFEYGAAGLPVIVPDSDNYRDYLCSEDWVTYADVCDPGSIARAIDSVLADRERYVGMSRAARKAHDERLNYETLFQPLLEKIISLSQTVT
jgi:glycosyltransferase involved in cell wall biosynthesis